jgi:hypothetical protein
MIFSGQLDSLTLEKSIQQNYAALALEHMEGMPHRSQRYLE